MASEAVIVNSAASRTFPSAGSPAGSLLVALLLAFPAFANGYLVFMATLVAINVIATTGLNITVGYAGLLSIGHSAFIGVGAYTGALHVDPCSARRCSST